MNNKFESLAKNLYMEVIVLIAYKNIPARYRDMESEKSKESNDKSIETVHS